MKKQIGIGSLSLLLVILAFFWSFSVFGHCLGDQILTILSLPAWSNGTVGFHYTVVYAYIFLIPALLFSIRYEDDLFATSGKKLSIIFICILLIAPIFMVF